MCYCEQLDFQPHPDKREPGAHPLHPQWDGEAHTGDPRWALKVLS